MTLDTSPARVVIAAPQGRSGKTTISLGICSALAARGLTVQPFKKGPDYIDPSWLSEAAGQPCRNLDPFFLPETHRLRQAFFGPASQADFSLIEGNHGLYDSMSGDGSDSTAAVARALHAPVILVVNAARMSRSAAAMVLGYQSFEPDTPIAAVILNNVAQKRHEDKLRTAIESCCHIPVIGAFPRQDELTIPDRHLGLVPRDEDDSLLPSLAACRQAAERYIDLDHLLAIARQAPAWQEAIHPEVDHDQPAHSAPRARLGIIRDRAFTFYYPENLEALQKAGAELVFIDALHDACLPLVDALYIGGGFPEMFLDELHANRSFRQDLRQAIEDGLPVYAECGGMMYLSAAIQFEERRTRKAEEDNRGKANKVEMVGALPFEVEVTAQPQGHGYILAECTHPNPFFSAGTILRGHEFHNSRLLNLREDWPTAMRLLRGNGLGNKRDALIYRNTLSGYTHLHALGSPEWAPALVNRAAAFASA